MFTVMILILVVLTVMFVTSIRQAKQQATRDRLTVFNLGCILLHLEGHEIEDENERNKFMNDMVGDLVDVLGLEL